MKRGNGMLVLSRQRDESVIITVPASAEPTEITTQVVDIRGDKVRIGYTAPKDCAVHREEIARRIEQEQRAGGHQ